jgi:hypothetical protein
MYIVAHCNTIPNLLKSFMIGNSVVSPLEVTFIVSEANRSCPLDVSYCTCMMCANSSLNVFLVFIIKRACVRTDMRNKSEETYKPTHVISITATNKGRRNQLRLFMSLRNEPCSPLKLKLITCLWSRVEQRNSLKWTTWQGTAQRHLWPLQFGIRKCSNRINNRKRKYCAKFSSKWIPGGRCLNGVKEGEDWNWLLTFFYWRN